MTRVKTMLTAGLIGMAGLIGWMLPAQAMSVSPMHLEMASVGGPARAQFMVVNNSNKPLPIESSLTRIELDENGVTKSTPAGDEFLVFPQQVMIAPGATQVFRVQWVGEPELAKSQSYILSVKEVPLKMPKGESGVQVVTGFGVVIDVAPASGQPEMKLVAAGIDTDKTGKRHPTITVANNSNVHGRLELDVLHVSAGGWTRTYQPSDIARDIGIGLVQPGKRRKFVLPDVLPAGASTVQASLEAAK